ncbi:M16 family metallopeptidase [Novosphingobium colocasiae]|uniref:M16 family metallopeptidase n=1 Tax=Novosphingobium colocasiae TaxID=1256513 RepID=UPI0035B45E16
MAFPPAALQRAVAALLASALTLSACAHVPPQAPQAAGESAAQPPAPATPQQLVSKVAIPYEKFVLANGLTTIVHTDRKAPIVAVTIYYKVGSKHEPKGRTGFAHLYEHLFFGGSAHVPNFDIPLEAAGSTPTNGSTAFDRTNYVETVPTGALDLALFMESDRMGYLLPAVTQDKLNKQRGVVQNEKRQHDNQPYGLFDYALAEGLLPVGHPYRHSPIGSMADLDAASLADVRAWFTDHYGPNNAVLVLSGDIDAATARTKVEQWFGGIPRGPDVAPVTAGPVTLPAPVRRDLADRVEVLRLTRNWTVPGMNEADTTALQVGAFILGGLASSRLDNELVRGKQLAVAVTASVDAQVSTSFLQVTMDVKPGVARADAEAALDAEIARFLRDGPSEDEVRRAVVTTLSAQIGALEQVGGFSGKGATLAEGEAYAGDPGRFAKDLADIAALTPETIRAAMNRWMGRPALALGVVPGARTDSGDAMGGWGDEAVSPAYKPQRTAKAAPLPPPPPRSAPPVAPIGDPVFPAIEHATLSNGITVALARRTAVPKVLLSLDFDAGTAADALDTPGTQGFMLAMLEQGAAGRDATQLAEDQERLGASIEAGADTDTSSVRLSALTDNLGPSLDLMADIVRRPSFAASDFARIADQRRAALAQLGADPDALAARTLGAAIYGSHPYAQAEDGLGDAAALAAMTPETLRAAWARWLRPDLARITVVGDIGMDQLKPLLERAFGNWAVPAGAAPAKPLDTSPPAAARRVILIDRPGSPQSVILAGRVLPVAGRGPAQVPLALANDVLAGGFLSRLNLDLREQKGWSYGVYSSIPLTTGPRAFLVSAPVQADRTADAIRAVVTDIDALPAKQPVSAEEHQRVTEGAIRAMPGQFETNAAVLTAMQAIGRLGRPDDYYARLAQAYRATGSTDIDAAARTFITSKDMTFVIVGDAGLVGPQLKKLGWPITIQTVKAVQ